jgi:hypothetical protein
MNAIPPSLILRRRAPPPPPPRIRSSAHGSDGVAARRAGAGCPWRCSAVRSTSFSNTLTTSSCVDRRPLLPHRRRQRGGTEQRAAACSRWASRMVPGRSSAGSPHPELADGAGEVMWCGCVFVVPWCWCVKGWVWRGSWDVAAPLGSPKGHADGNSYHAYKHTER